MRSRFARIVVWLWALLFSIVGLVASGFLTYEHVQSGQVASSRPASAPASTVAAAADEQGLLDSICTAYTTWSCEKVSQSKWGRFPFGQPEGKPSVPTAELGLVFFIFVICWLLVMGPRRPTRWWPHFLFALANAAGVGASVFLEIVMWTHLEFRCPFCIAAHAASFLVFICVLLLWPRAEREATASPVIAQPGTDSVVVGVLRVEAPWPTGRAIFAALILFLLASGFQHFFWMSAACRVRLGQMGDTQCQKDLKSWKWYADHYRRQFRLYDGRWEFVYWLWKSEPALPLVLDGEPARGPADARHTIVLFSDVQCPACGQFEDETLKAQVEPMAAQHGGVKVIFKHYPLCSECNPHSTNVHPEACMGARAIEAARIVGGDDAFWRMHDHLIRLRSRMKGVGKEWFVRQAAELKLDTGAFAAAMDSEEAIGRVRRHIEEGANLGKGVVPPQRLNDYRVTGTPVVIVNHRILRNPRHSRAWLAILSNPAPPPPQGALPQAPPATPADAGPENQISSPADQ
ncbi:MAG TPA: vitamin K epoxide reductase family protein [Phycisphaerae bacterium]|nr:vitamin K epoxide reductase family protein [Phycisphaerae bacterium]